MNRLFYTIFSNIDIFKVIKNTFIFITECVAMNLIFLGLACFVNPDIIVKNLLTELSLKNSYALYLCIIILYEGSRNFISYAFFTIKNHLYQRFNNRTYEKSERIMYRIQLWSKSTNRGFRLQGQTAWNYTNGSCLSGSFVLYMCNNSYHVWISAFYARYFTILKSGDDNL